MTERENRLKKIQTHVDKIDKLQSEIRKIVPRRTRRITQEYSIQGVISNDGEIKRSNEDSPEPFDILNYLRLSTNSESTLLNTVQASDLQYFQSTENAADRIPNLRDASVQTTKKTEIHHEAYDILNYFQLPKESKNHRKPSRPCGRSFNDCKVSKLSGPLDPVNKKKKNDLRIGGELRGAAAGERKAPAGSSYQQPKQQQQVHASRMLKLATDTPRQLRARSQRTRGDDGRSDEIRVPGPKPRASWTIIKWARPIGLQRRLARMLTDRRGSELDHKRQKQIELGQDEQPIMQPRKPDSAEELDKQEGHHRRIITRWLQHITRPKTKTLAFKDVEAMQSQCKKRLWGLLDTSKRMADRSNRAGVTVPHHYPGDRTPRLVEADRTVILDGKTETLRVISSAVGVCIRR